MTTRERIEKRLRKVAAETIERDRKANTPMERIRFYYWLRISHARSSADLEILEHLGSWA